MGALASLQVGPGAGNLMGCSRAAQMATDAMDTNKAFPKYKNATRNVQGWYKSNRYAEILGYDDESSSDEESDSDEEISKVGGDGYDDERVPI